MVLESFFSYGLVEEAVEYAKVGSHRCTVSVPQPVLHMCALVHEANIDWR